MLGQTKFTTLLPKSPANHYQFWRCSSAVHKC